MLDLQNMTLEQLRELQSLVSSAIEEFDSIRRREAISELHAVARKHGYRLKDLTGVHLRSTGSRSIPARKLSR